MLLDPDDLAAAALQRGGERPELVPDDVDDLATLEAFRRIVGAGRRLDPADLTDDEPPADLWDRIAASLGEPTHSIADDRRPADGPVVIHHADVPPHHRREPAGAPVVSLDSRRRRPWQTLAAVAAVAVLVAGLAGVVISQQGSSGQELVAGADLAVLGGGGAGEAQLVRRDDGLHLVVDVSGLSPAEQADFFELWLLSADPEDPDPQSLEKFEVRDGTLDVRVPDSIDTERFRVVDISGELDDGDDSHSGKSILRGELA